MKRVAQVICVSDESAAGGLRQIGERVLRIAARALNPRVEEFRFIGPYGSAAVVSHLRGGGLARALQGIDRTGICASGCKAPRVEWIKTYVRTVGNTDNAVKRLFHSLRDAKAAFTEIEDGFSTGKTILLFYGIKESIDIGATTLGHGHV